MATKKTVKTNKIPIALRINEGLLLKLQKIADEENRTLTNKIETVLKNYVDEVAAGIL